ncbi:hypothetical protein SFPGR_26320 [Sulfuriferula plumbiphila]|nr:hypothetical protein SFPGR_26320 [Sulfuriferula plumbiphila]
MRTRPRHGANLPQRNNNVTDRARGGATYAVPLQTCGSAPGGFLPARLPSANFVPFFDYPPELRKAIYTTNAIESVNMSRRKVTKRMGLWCNCQE